MSEAQVLDAVKALHDVGTDDEQRTAVSNYLSSFQRSLLSWNVSMNLLSRPGALDSQLFAAQTLKEKLRGHSWQLSHDSWQPVRSCIVSVLQRPCEPALEVQVSLCLVALIILTSSDDVISQLRQALPPTRTLLVLQLLGEEVGADTSPYEPAPGAIRRRLHSPAVQLEALQVQPCTQPAEPFLVEYFRFDYRCRQSRLVASSSTGCGQHGPNGVAIRH